MSFSEALRATYRENPAQVLPNALWKTCARLGQLQTEVEQDNAAISALRAWDTQALLLYWTRDRTPLPDSLLTQPPRQLAVIHQDYLSVFAREGFGPPTPYFRLVHRLGSSTPLRVLPSGFHGVDADLKREYVEISQLIGQCYPDLHPTPETVLRWSQHPTYDATLWVWIVDGALGIPVGLGIAERDPETAEGSLEWIQVLPSYRGRGLGTWLVQELLQRLENCVDFTTVSGRQSETGHLEALYRRCGFQGTDLWWVFRAP